VSGGIRRKSRVDTKELRLECPRWRDRSTRAVARAIDGASPNRPGQRREMMRPTFIAMAGLLVLAGAARAAP
jgi:hypothetical protein